VRLTFFSTNLGTVTWPATVFWPGPTYAAPSFTAGPLKAVVVALEFLNSGNWLANASVY
jgi:hypothetical protein